MRYVTATWQYAGIHWWAAAEAPVAYLSLPHRHLFKCKLWLQVFGDDREVEFIQLKDFVQSLVLPTYGDEFVKNQKLSNLGSCEMQAKYIAIAVQVKYPGRRVRISVSEDGENGAFLKFD